MIDDYNGTTKGITGDNFDYTQSNTGEAGRPPLRTGQDAEPSKFNLYLSPSKNVKYGDNMNNTTSNSTKYKINSGYRVDSNKYIETGTMQKENVLSELASEYDDYYKGWEITTYSTITSKNNRLIFLYGSTEHHIDIEDGSYSGDGLATELENKMNSILSLETTPITVSFSGSTNKLTFTSSASTLTFKWKTTCENYFTNIHEVLGFNKTDDSAVSTVTSPNKVQLYISDNGESSLIDSYNGTNKLVSIISLKTRKSHPSVATKTGPFTKYILSPPKHINGSLSIKGENNIYIDNENSIGNDDFYNGWTLLTHTNGIHQFSNITDYDSSTKKITLPSLDLDTLSSSNSLYTIVNKKHLNGYLRKSGNNVFPQGDKKGVLSVSGFTMHQPSVSDSDTDPTQFTLKIYGSDFKWFGLPQPSTTDDYYNDWKISIYINNKEYSSTVQKYYGAEGDNQYKIILSDINYNIFSENEDIDEIVFKYILYEPSYYMLL